MIRYKELLILYLSSLFQISLVQSQSNGGFANYGPYYVPNTQGGGSSFPTSGPVNYAPVTGYSGFTYPTQNTVQPFEQYPQNGQHIYSNTPTVSYQGLDEANALRSAYPNQPIIIINNGGNGDTGGNSNNGNNNGKKGNGFNLGDLAAIFLASSHHRGHGGFGLGGEPRPELEPEIAAPPVVVPQAVNSGFDKNFNYNAGPREGDGGNNRCSTVTHITIVLPPSTSVTVSAEEKKKTSKKGDNEQMKKCKDGDDELKESKNDEKDKKMKDNKDSKDNNEEEKKKNTDHDE